MRLPLSNVTSAFSTASCTFGPKYRRAAICIATSPSTSASNSCSSRFRCRATDGSSSRFRKSASLAFCGVGSAPLKAPSSPSIDVRMKAFHSSSDIFIGGPSLNSSVTALIWSWSAVHSKKGLKSLDNTLNRLSSSSAHSGVAGVFTGGQQSSGSGSRPSRATSTHLLIPSM